jgi:hypothetical protein
MQISTSWRRGPLAVICSALIRGDTRLHHEAGQPEPLEEIVSALI